MKFKNKLFFNFLFRFFLNKTLEKQRDFLITLKCLKHEFRKFLNYFYFENVYKV